MKKLFLIAVILLVWLLIEERQINLSTLYLHNNEVTKVVSGFPQHLSASVSHSFDNLEPLIKKRAIFSNPLDGHNLYHENDTPASRQAEIWRSDSQKAYYMNILASQPRAIWFGAWNKNVKEAVSEKVIDASKKNQLPVLVAYNIPSYSCELYKNNKKMVTNEYLNWINEFAKGIGNNKAVVILEPDALAGHECLSTVSKNENLLRKAVIILKNNPSTVVYVDAGHAIWNPSNVIASKLNKAGIDIADGFSLNVSNFIGDQKLIEYGTELSEKIGNKHFVIDSSRNGNGPTEDYQWCNPFGRAIGKFPTTRTDNPLIDAYLWIKQPGESDGTCNGGPEAGNWWAEYALELVQNAKLY